MYQIFVPPLLNAPLDNIEDDRPLVQFNIRHNKTLSFIENDEFDESLVPYDNSYQNAQIQSQSFRDHLDKVIGLIKTYFEYDTKIIEVGCGKADFLTLLESSGYQDVFGYDTTYDGDAKNILKRYLREDDETNTDLFILRHTLEHIPKPYNFLKMLKKINQGKGFIYIEVPCLDWIRENNAFYDVAYEHCNYFTLHTLKLLFSNNFLTSGRSFGDQYIHIIADLQNLSDNFENTYIDSSKWEYLKFIDLFPHFQQTISTIENRISQKRHLFIWGGAGKTGTFLWHCLKYSPEIIEKLKFVVDINPKKIGKFLPGSKIQIHSPKEIYRIANSNDIVLVMNPNYIHEVKSDLESNKIRKIEIFTL